MANLRLSKQGYSYLTEIMAELGLERSETKNERPQALKLAFAKGIAAENLPDVSQKKKFSGFEFPSTVIAKGDDILLVKHLIIDKLQRNIENDELNKYILLFVEHGLEVMHNEIKELTNMDQYLIYLLEKHAT